jgi:hypothetical protein
MTTVQAMIADLLTGETGEKGDYLSKTEGYNGRSRGESGRARANVAPCRGESPQNRPDSPPRSPSEHIVIKGDSPLSPLSPREGAKDESLKHHRRWFISMPDGRLYDSTFNPGATSAEVSRWYPDATIEPAPEEAISDPIPEAEVAA